MNRSITFTLGPVAVELTGLQLLETYDLEALDAYKTGAAPEFSVELVAAFPADCAHLARDTSEFDADGSVLCMRYASWVATVDVSRRETRAYLPNRGLFDNFLRTMAQIVPLVTNTGLAMHAASLSFGGRAIVMAGKSNVGKSTSAVRALAADRTLLAEDLTLIGGFDEGRPAVYPSPLRNHCGVIAGPMAVPLARVYGLRQAAAEKVVTLETPEAMAVLQENVAIGTRQPSLVLRALQCARILVDDVGVRRLEVSREGPFWRDVERDLRADDTSDPEVT